MSKSISASFIPTQSAIPHTSSAWTRWRGPISSSTPHALAAFHGLPFRRPVPDPIAQDPVTLEISPHNPLAHWLGQSWHCRCRAWPRPRIRTGSLEIALGRNNRKLARGRPHGGSGTSQRARLERIAERRELLIPITMKKSSPQTTRLSVPQAIGAYPPWFSMASRSSGKTASTCWCGGWGRMAASGKKGNETGFRQFKGAGRCLNKG